MKDGDGTAAFKFQLQYWPQKNKQTLWSCKSHPDLLRATAQAGATLGI